MDDSGKDRDNPVDTAPPSVNSISGVENGSDFLTSCLRRENNMEKQTGKLIFVSRAVFPPDITEGTHEQIRQSQQK